MSAPTAGAVRAVVFAGPSVGADALQEAFGAPGLEVLPPVRRGDVDALWYGERPPTHVGIVDGEFMQSLMISPKEIARCLEDRDARFYGSSSIGALRAVELASLGMVGVGRVVELYRSGTTNADDEVAMVYDAEELRPLCEPMVNIRLAVSDAVEQGVITAATGEVLIRVTRELYFPDRTYRAVLAAAAEHLDPAEHAAATGFLVPAAPDAKRDDAIALVQRMAADIGDPPR